MRDNKNFRQLTYYGTIGIITNISGYALYLLLTSLGSSPKITMTFLYFFGATLSYLGNKKLTFNSKSSHNSILRYIAVQLAAYLLNLMLHLVLVDQIGYPHQWIQAFAIVFVALFIFIAFKFYVFPVTKE